MRKIKLPRSRMRSPLPDEVIRLEATKMATHSLGEEAAFRKYKDVIQHADILYDYIKHGKLPIESKK